MAEPILVIRDVAKRFGGLAAVDGVSLALAHGEIHAVIGPNGAGKSTLINLLSGDLASSAGSIRYDGIEVAGAASHRISRLGVGRSYQKTNIFAAFTAFENCRLAAQSRLRSSMRFLAPSRRRADLAAAAERALALAGLAGREAMIAASLSHGEQRQLEIAMTLATAPRVLLLDEPLAGMGAEEGQRIVALLRRLRDDHAILLVEHDMDAVFSLADRLTVMVNGRVLESGAPEAIRASAAVQAAYLGAPEEDAADDD
jgi:branched-chain amino acid transport system ATP-binding protein